MKWKNRLTNYNFWISMVSAVLLILQALNIKFDIMYINEIATAVLGLLVVVGIVNDPTSRSNKPVDEKKENETEQAKTNIVEVTAEEKETELPEIENNNIPIEEENEVVADNAEIDFQTVINQIKTDLIKTQQANEELKLEILNLVTEMTKENVAVENKQEISEKQVEIEPELEIVELAGNQQEEAEIEKVEQPVFTCNIVNN